jgi:hypothetical protein
MRRGDVYPVTDSSHYSLPRDLEDGTFVRLLEFDAGYWTVATEEGKTFTVFQARIDSGMEYEWRGCWLPAYDPRVVAERRESSLASSRAYSCVNGGCVVPPLPV